MTQTLGLVSVRRVLALSLLAAAFALTPFAQIAQAQSATEGVRDLYVVDGRDAVIEQSRGEVEPNLRGQQLSGQAVPLPPAPSIPTSGGAGLMWREADAGQGWIGRTVALGDHGTQVFTEFDVAADRTQLVSSFDSAPVTPLFQYPQVPGSQNAKVDAAQDAGVYASCRQVPVSGPSGPRNTFVSAYTALGGLAWTYQFPTATYGPARAMVSRDGTRIVAGMLDSNGKLQLRVFQSGSGVPVWEGSFTNGPQLRSLLLTADGSLVYWASGTTCTIWNVDTHQILANFVLISALDCHAISADGRVFAYGGFNYVDVYERQPTGNYVRTHVWNVPGQAVCSKLDVSADGSTIVAGFNLWDFNVGVKIMALDVPTKTVTMTDTAIGAGTLQNIVSDIVVSADGQRFVVGLWGDEAGLVDDLRFYRRHQNAPVATYAYPGSVYDVDLTSDGLRVAVAAKAVHANLYMGGGTIDLYAFEREDLVMRGIPRAGSVVRFEMSNAPNSPARLLSAPSAAMHPLFLGGIGTLQLNRFTMSSVSMGTTGPDGVAVRDYTFSGPAHTIGTKRCFQGVVTSPRRLTDTWIELTVLP